MRFRLKSFWPKIAFQMRIRSRPFAPSMPSMAAFCLIVLTVIMWIAGGASRGDVLGQTVVRSVAWASLIIIILFGHRHSLENERPVLFLLLATIALPLLQLVPLPPAIWQQLPGRDLVIQTSIANGRGQPWRPLSMVPGGTLNALSSLVVPIAIFLSVVRLREAERSWLPAVMLSLVGASVLVGLSQLSGGSFDNPFVNEPRTSISGPFANRNHFGLFLAMGCLIAPVWAFLDERRLAWRGPVALGCIVLFVLMILASGSRAGMVGGALAIFIGLALVGKDLRRTLRHAPRWVFPAIGAAIVAVLVIFVLASIAAGRALSVDRLMEGEVSEDLRNRALPTLLAMVSAYFPFGNGFGSFDPLFRIHEPFDLLQVPYFNNAHNDLLELTLNAGILGILVLVSALGWLTVCTVKVWHGARSTEKTLGRLGSAMLFVIFLASIVDYPARTPLIMMTITIAALWLNWGANTQRSAPLRA